MNTNVFSFLVGCIVTSALFWCISPDNTFYGADIYYRDGRRVYTESSSVDSTFFTARQAADYLEQKSADDFNQMMEAWKQDFIYNYMAVLVFNDGTVQLNYEDGGEWWHIELCKQDCDDYGSCMYYVEYSDVGEYTTLTNKN